MNLFKNISKNWKTIALASSAFLFLFIFLGYHNVFFRGPYGMHFMRQTDSLSFVSQYFNNGFHFFDPQLFNLKNIDGRAACEFPILYYITSLLYIIIGKKLFLLKFIYLLISFTGLFYVYRLSYLILKDQIYAIFTALFLCTSTVFNFYAFNYLPDAPALGFVFIAWYYGFQFSLKGEKSALIKAFAFFTLGSLIKVTYLINPIAFIGYFVYLQVFQKQAINKLQHKASLFKWGAINLLLVGSWNAYMLYYNQQYDSHSFNTTTLPIWEQNNQNIVLTWDYMMNYWYSSYFAHSSFHFLLIVFIFQIIYLKKSNYNLSLLTAFMLIGSLSFGLLFYAQFKDHDYYFLTFIPLLILLLINGINTFKNISTKRNHHNLVKAILFLIIVAGINYSRNKLDERYRQEMNKYSRTGLLIDENKMAIDGLNIPKDAKVILAPEPSQNGGLFYLDRMGWTISSIKEVSSTNIRSLKQIGAEYLILTELNNLTINKIEHEGKIILRNNDLMVFHLQ